MVEVKVLYEVLNYIEYAGFRTILNNQKNKFNQRFDEDINVDFCFEHTLIDELKDNGYDVVVLHIGGGSKDDRGRAFKRARQVRLLHKGALIAESSHHPWSNDEILKHFDEYLPPLADVSQGYLTFVKLLETHKRHKEKSRSI